MKIFKRTISALLLILSIALILWFGCSYIEVISKNLEPNPEYSKYNFFVIAFNTQEDGF